MDHAIQNGIVFTETLGVSRQIVYTGAEHGDLVLYIEMPLVPPKVT